ncbi:HipA domain-containing protein [Achromobacter sp. GG226]|uniref:HipA domain-containing protein n=1 Tax=Verticiella alkaliphila TaxID=2779529 RepID=UPI001C0D9D78|nr:HipA domain-containing protein [Verticiella sp. GG226]MBU4610927.1 HipA domain-containing protein [Verticiella sp. GG226]
MPERATEAPPPYGRRLCIYSNHVHVATLHEDNDLWTLAYSPQWAASEDGFDLSPALPRAQPQHRDGATSRPVQWYFDNLLPEERLRELIATDANLRNHDDAFALLEYLGAESAGSLTLLPEGQEPEAPRTLKPLSYEALSQRIQALPHATLTREAPKRMSLAGAQHKMLAVIKGQDVYEPVGSTPSTHILKPDHPSRDTYPASAYLEWLTMTLAQAAGLEVPTVALLHVPEPAYVIERFDRRVEPAALAPTTGEQPPDVGRVHAIDACQLLNKSRVFKYGKDVRTLREISQACSDTLMTPVRLFRWLVFNLLVANDDCHLKNLSFLVTPGRVDLAPHYDLLATGVYHTRAFAEDEGKWPHVSLAIHLSQDVVRFDQVTPQAVLTAGHALGVPERVAMRTVRDVVTRVLGAFDAVYAEHDPEDKGLLARYKARDSGADGSETATMASETRWGGPGTGAEARPPQDSAQQWRILRVLRHIVLPDMMDRLVP